MSRRPLAAELVILSLLTAGSSCSRPAEDGSRHTSSSSTVRPREARLETMSDIKTDEKVVFYSTYAWQAGDNPGWTVAIHGSIFEPEPGSLKRAAAIESLRAALGLSRSQTESDIFRQRARAFLVDNERGKRIAVRLGDKVYDAGTSEPNGHFSALLRFSAAEADDLRRNADRQGWLEFRAVTRRDDSRTFAGRVQWLVPEGVSVISDIDDTIKISNVQDRQDLLANTFLRAFRPVPGAAPLYCTWADAGAALHYVSASPWQLYEPLADFCRQEGFPAGTFHMKLVRLHDSSAANLIGSQEAYKTEIIEKILADFPRRRFALVGDSGENDPEIYAAVTRKHPTRIQHVFIRNVGGRGSLPDRFQKAFEGIPAAQWQIFTQPSELPEQL